MNLSTKGEDVHQVSSYAVRQEGPAEVLMICDFDGTVSTIDVGYQILKKFSKDHWEIIDRDYCSGRIGSLEAYTKIASVIRAQEKDFRDYLPTLTQIDSGFIKFYKFCRDRSWDVKIVSDGLDYYIGHILSHYGLNDIEYFSNHLIFKGGSGIDIEFPLRNEKCMKCGTCKKNILLRYRNTYRKIFYVGDGYSDICPSNIADLVFGKNVLYRHSVEHGLQCVHYSNFGEVQTYFETEKME